MPDRLLQVRLRNGADFFFFGKDLNFQLFFKGAKKWSSKMIITDVKGQNQIMPYLWKSVFLWCVLPATQHLFTCLVVSHIKSINFAPGTSVVILMQHQA